MKTLVLSLLLAAPLAHADFNTDAKEGAIKCTGKGVVVSLNAKRDTIQLQLAARRPEKLSVEDRQSDGDTFVSYVSQDSDVVVSLDDRGDSLELRDTHETIALRCK